MTHRDFWDNGYRVFGLHGFKQKKCLCGQHDCKAAGKHPLTSSWQHTPHWSSEQFEFMEEVNQFSSGYGVLVRGLLVIDVDARNGGVISYAQLENDFPSVANAGLIVKTGSGNGSKHLYYKVPEDIALIQHHPDYDGIDFKSSGFVVGPSSLHVSGNKYEVAFGSVDAIEDIPNDLLAILRKPERHRAIIDGLTVDVTNKELADMLSHVDADADHDTWVKCGMAIHHASAGTAFDVWDKWSARGSKYPDSEVLFRRWHSFGKASNPVTLGTLKHYAEQGGWVEPVTFEPNEVISPTIEATDEIDLSGIDLKRPPGFVGQVTDWINTQCRYPRENLAVAAALTSVGNILGLRYADDLQDVTTNLFSFCVAGSGTGKEAIQQATLAIHRAARINAAVHGNIKSEQEILRNLTDHQAAFYIIDEIGIMLKKIKNAQIKGGAVYLDGIIGMLMSVYSKANGYLAITGDMRKEVKKSLLAEINQLNKQLEEGTKPHLEARLLSATKALEGLDDGIEKPFLSLLGFTTPVTFDDLVDFESATNGFIGRSLLFNERETVPMEKEDFMRTEMDERLKNALANLYSAGSFDVTETYRVEYYGEKKQIPTTEGSRKLLKQVMKILHTAAEEAKDKTGLEALYLRSKEAVAKISFILAAPEGIRTEEHVRWAYALIKRDVEEKSRLVIGNDRRKDSPAQALAARVVNLLAGDDGETLGVICNRLRPTRKEDIEKCLALLVGEKKITFTETTHPKKKTITRRYKTT